MYACFHGWNPEKLGCFKFLNEQWGNATYMRRATVIWTKTEKSKLSKMKCRNLTCDKYQNRLRFQILLRLNQFENRVEPVKQVKWDINSIIWFNNLLMYVTFTSNPWIRVFWIRKNSLNLPAAPYSRCHKTNMQKYTQVMNLIDSGSLDLTEGYES